MLTQTERAVSLPMYALPEMEDANSAFLQALRQRLCIRGVDTGTLASDHDDDVFSASAKPLFTQICGYPLFKLYRGRYRMLATPHYSMPGCSGPNHRAFFMVRADDPAERLEDLQGRVFGCNSPLSNSGMNLPRLSLARIAGGQPFFSSVIVTGAHIKSLEHLDRARIDLCSVDSVTWGFFRKFRPAAAERYRVLAETVPSPSLPFVTSIDTSESDAAVITDALHEILNDPETAKTSDGLALNGLSVPDVVAYERLAQYEREAIELGFPEIS